MSWLVADENGPMLCGIEIPQSSNYGGRGGGGVNGYKLSAQRLLGSFCRALLMAALKIIYQAKLTLAPKRSHFH